ncbi:hypothetical protein TNCV_2183851 [Trichonephila clavipes]|nr:hypothetical protein TNCV_2183851 [Trichonephila clavipes]
MEKDLAVAVDGSWQKRGFSSKNGLLTVTSVDTGKVIDVEVFQNIVFGPNKTKHLYFVREILLATASSAESGHDSRVAMVENSWPTLFLSNADASEDHDIEGLVFVTYVKAQIHNADMVWKFGEGGDSSSVAYTSQSHLGALPPNFELHNFKMRC